MSIKISENRNIPQGYRHLTEEELIKDYFGFDLDENTIISKNEWMLKFIGYLANDLKSLEKEGPDSIMKKIKELSDEFDKYDTDGNKYLEYQEYREILLNNIFISD